MNQMYKEILNIRGLPLTVKKALIIGINWTFQSILYMDKTERAFKICLDAFFMVVFTILFSRIISIPTWSAAVLAFIVGHTLNWLLNGNLFALFKTFGTVITPQEKFEGYIKRLQENLRNEPSIAWAGVYGSLVRGEFKETSDLDVRLIRKPGLINGVRACVFVMRERTWANLNRFPLDIYVFDDSAKLLKKMNIKESPNVIYKD